MTRTEMIIIRVEPYGEDEERASVLTLRSAPEDPMDLPGDQHTGGSWDRGGTWNPAWRPRRF